jgi:hypothetical protein
MSLLFLTNYLASHGEIDGKPVHYMVHNKRGSILAQMRQSQVELALENKATHLLFIDSDQTFPRDLFHRLFAHRKQVVSVNVATKCIPANSTARLKGPTCEGIPLYTTPESTELVEVWRIGTGIMLIDLNIFKREGLKTPPWFDQVWSEETQSYIGEDWGFCQKLEDAGVKLWVDQDLSREVGHIGALNYGHDLVVPKELQEVG